MLTVVILSFVLMSVVLMAAQRHHENRIVRCLTVNGLLVLLYLVAAFIL